MSLQHSFLVSKAYTNKKVFRLEKNILALDLVADDRLPAAVSALPESDLEVFEAMGTLQTFHAPLEREGRE
jgi:hypothetical protein